MTTMTDSRAVDVRGLVAKWREPKAKHVRPDTSEYAQGFAHGMSRCADELESALATEGVQAGEVEQRARELLAAECGVSPTAFNDALPNATVSESIAIRAIVAALTGERNG